MIIMKRQITKILDLAEVRVKSQKILDSNLILEVEKTEKIARCPRFSKVSRRLYQNHWSLIKDLPWGKKEIFLRVNR
jgi:transposase